MFSHADHDVKKNPQFEPQNEINPLMASSKNDADLINDFENAQHSNKDDMSYDSESIDGSTGSD